MGPEKTVHPSPGDPMGDFLYGMDVAVFRFLNGSLANPLFDVLMPFLTDLNKQPVALAVLAGILLWLLIKGGQTGRTVVLLLVVTITLSDQFNSSFVKHLFQRVRPCHALTDVHLLVSCGSGYAFPSSHAVNNAAGAVILSFFYRKWLWAFAAFAGIIAFSRVSVGVHYPSDVVAGVLLGSGIAALVLLAYQAVKNRWTKRTDSGVDE